MTTAVRLVAAFGAFLLAHGVAFAQLPEAPPPHPALDELVKEYKRLGLPEPLPKAEFVRLSWGDGIDYFAFRYPPAKPGEPSRYLTGTRLWPLYFSQPPTSETVVKPIPSAIKGRWEPWSDRIGLAVQFKIRGWDDLATSTYALARRELAEWLSAQNTTSTVMESLHSTAWGYWEGRLIEPYSDRKVAFAQLSGLAKSNPEFITWRKQFLLPDLELTLAPRKSKPGSLEALLDDLTDYGDGNQTGEKAYWKLVELGFDAVPALMEHVLDHRLTRTRTYDLKAPEVLTVWRVGGLVESVLTQLSGGRYEDEAYWTPNEQRKPPKEHKWWTEARKVGEEKWLAESVIPKIAAEDREPPTELLLRLIRVKHPRLLKDVYQRLLLIHEPIECVASSKR